MVAMTPSIDAYLCKEHSCQISFEMAEQSLRLVREIASWMPS